MNTCPVCGYPNMDAPAIHEEICSCCGTQFGYDDYVKTHEELRHEWLSKGAPWFAVWENVGRIDVRSQLQGINYTPTTFELLLIAGSHRSADILINCPEAFPAIMVDGSAGAISSATLSPQRFPFTKVRNNHNHATSYRLCSVS